MINHYSISTLQCGLLILTAPFVPTKNIYVFKYGMICFPTYSYAH